MRSVVINCGPSSCAGCCVGNSACSDGTHGAACGHGGAMCETCSARSGESACEPEASGPGGHCEYTSAPCDANSCPTGCCVSGVCAQGAQDIACGGGGVACADCTTAGLTCVFRQCGGGFQH